MRPELTGSGRLSAVCLFLLAILVPSAWAQSEFPNGFPGDAGFFPIGVWLQSPPNAPNYRAIGVNTFVALFDGPTEADLETLAKYGMFAIATQNKTALASPHRDVIKAWLQMDEPDNAQPTGSGSYGPCIAADEVARQAAAMKARDATRPIFINFGRGIADRTWEGRGACTGDMKYYDAAIKGSDILSFDIYPIANATPRKQDQLDYVARGVDGLTSRAAPGQSVWAILETSKIQSDRLVTPAQLRAEAWLALTHGAKGIVYFAHEWTGGFREDGIFRHPEIVAAVTGIDREIAALAPVLNTGTDAKGAVTPAAPLPLSMMVKRQGDTLYVFAVNAQDQPIAVRFGVSGMAAEATVLGEDRKLAVREGGFEDAFAGYAVHLYRLAAGSAP